MADLSDSQRKRAEARDRRRKQQPDDPGSDEAAETVSANTDEQPNQAVRQAAKIAAAVGAAGAAAAAARVLSSHDENEQPEPEEQNEPEPEQNEPQAREPDEPEQEREPEHEPEHEPDEEPEEEPREQVAGANQGDARRVLDRARDQLEDLLGRPVESVSSLERTHDGWVLALEVVEVKRIPETTDILASYELELDGDLNLRRYQQGRRYHRAHAGGGGDE